MGNITKDGEVEYSNLVYSDNESEIIEYQLKKGDILFNRTNSSEWVGKSALYDGELEAIYAGYLVRVRPIMILSEYLILVMTSSYYRNWCHLVKTDAVNQSNINAQKLKSFLLPLPPLKEQRRIYDNFLKLSVLVRNISDSCNKLSDMISLTKSKILDLAMQGKLVPQDSSDEPAADMLRRINPKAKIITDNPHSWNVPANWTVCNLGDTVKIRSAKRVMKSDWRTEGVPFYRTREIVKLSENGIVDNELFISYQLYEEYREKYGIPVAGDIMITAVGTIGKTYIVRHNDKFYYKDASVLCISPYPIISSDFLTYLFRSEYLKKQLMGNSKGTTVDTITIEKANSYTIALPPFNEQKRMVAKIEELYSVLDKIEASLRS